MMTFPFNSARSKYLREELGVKPNDPRFTVCDEENNETYDSLYEDEDIDQDF